MPKLRASGQPMPDHSTCRHCGIAISWDEYSYTHDDTGFADCGIVFSGGQRTSGGSFLLNPEITMTRTDGARAEPIEWKEVPT